MTDRMLLDKIDYENKTVRLGDVVYELNECIISMKWSPLKFQKTSFLE